MDAAAPSSSPRTPRTRYRISLRGFLLAISLLAVVLAWFGQWMAAKQREERARRWLLDHGASVGQFNGWDMDRRE